MSSVAQHRGVVTVLSERSSRRRTGCRGAASASQGHFIGFGYNSCLTIRSSRTRFVTWLKCVVVPLQQLTDQHVAGRLNSGVSPQTAVQRVVGFGAAVARSLRLVLLRGVGRFIATGQFLCRCIVPALHAPRLQHPQRREGLGVESSSVRRYGCRRAPGSSRQAAVSSATTAA